MLQALILSSGRLVPIKIEGEEFFILRTQTLRDRLEGMQPVAGPFPLNDPRFQIIMTQVKHDSQTG